MKKFLMTVFALLTVGVAFSWNYTGKRDAFTDEDSSYIFVSAEESNQALLIIRCAAHEPTGLDVLILAHRYLGEARFDYRIDSMPMVSNVLGWKSVGGDSVFFRDDDVLRVVHGEMFGGSRFLVRLYTFSGTSYTYTFNTAGFSEAFSNISHCVK